MTLSTETIILYARLKARIERLEKRKEILSDEIKQLMKDEDVEEFAPKDAPFKFRLSVYDRASVKWKDVAMKFARQLFGKKSKEEVEKEAETYPETRVESLFCEFNERYRHPKGGGR